MRKFTILLLLAVFSFASFAQRTSAPLTDRIDSHETTKSKPTKSTETILLEEDFASWPPSGWEIKNGAESSDAENWHSLSEVGINAAAILYVDGSPKDEWLISPFIDVPANGGCELSFQFTTDTLWNIDYDYADIMVKVSTDNGTTWSDPIWQEDDPVLLAQSGVYGPLNNDEWYFPNVSLDAYLGQTIKIAIHYLDAEGDGDLFIIDNIEVNHVVFNTDATLAAILVDGVTIDSFDPATYSYDVTLDYGTTKVPKVLAFANDWNVFVTPQETDTLPGTTTVNVVAEDGTTTLTYYVNFILPIPDATLNDLTVDGTTVVGFDSSIYVYNIPLVSGTTVPPTVNAALSSIDATKDITQAAAIPGTATVKVLAGDGITEGTYNVNFYIVPDAGKDSLLIDLLVDGVTIPNFSPSVNDYTYMLPPGSTTAPTITYAFSDANATAAQDTALTLADTTKIVVASDDSTAFNTYSVDFYVISDDATLNDLALDGTTLIGFDPATLTYTYTLDKSATAYPAVTYILNDVNATAVPVVLPAELPELWTQDTAYVIVTAEDGITEITYNIIFDFDVNNDATLSDLQIDGTTVSGFSPSKYNYTYTISSTQIIPTVSATANGTNATVDIKQAGTSSSIATITVTAEDTKEQLVYAVEFIVQSSNAMLSNLTIDDTTVADFESWTYEYTYSLAEGASIPTVEATTQEGSATFGVNATDTLPGTTTIIVTAEDGTELTYKINFTVEGSNSIADLELMNSLSVYPNPSNGLVNISLTSNQDVTLSLINTAGQELINKTYTVAGQFNEQLDLQALPKGIYIIKLSTNNGNAIQRIVLE